MPDFQYTAREISGRQVTGVLSAASEHDALGSLAAKSLFPVNIALADGAKSESQLMRGRVRARHLAVFYTQLADLLRSGVPLLRSLELLERQTSQKTLKHIHSGCEGTGGRWESTGRIHEADTPACSGSWA